MTDMLALGQHVLESQSFSVMLGTRIVAFNQHETVLELDVKPEFLQQFGFVHGGVLSYLADNALTFAGGSVLGVNIVTAEYKVNYVRPAKGMLLRARSSVIAAGKRQAVCSCSIFVVDDDQEILCAVAQGTIMATERTS